MTSCTRERQYWYWNQAYGYSRSSESRSTCTINAFMCMCSRPTAILWSSQKGTKILMVIFKVLKPQRLHKSFSERPSNNSCHVRCVFKTFVSVKYENTYQNFNVVVKTARKLAQAWMSYSDLSLCISCLCLLFLYHFNSELVLDNAITKPA